MEGKTEGSSLVGLVCTHGLFWLRFNLGLPMMVEYFGGSLTWWFSPLGPVLLLSHCKLYKMDKVTIYCHGFYSSWL